MNRTALCLSLGLLAPLAAQAQSGMPANCPMHAEHQKQAADAARAAASAASPYVGFTGRDIAALSAEEIDALRSGAGHGFALPAELNRYPGPRHLLDLAPALGLEAGATRELQAIFDRMHAGAVPLGEQIVAGERELDRLFAEGRATNAEVARLSAEIARLQGSLRATHLVAHVEARALLSSDQIAHYDALRGYGSAAGAK